MILSCRGDRYGRLDTLNVKIHPLFQNLLAFLMEAKKWEKSEEEEEEEEHGTRNTEEESYSYRRGYTSASNYITVLCITSMVWLFPEPIT